MFRVLAIAAVAIVASACGSGPQRGLLDPAQAAQSASLARHDILVATTRTRSADPAILFDGGRAPELGFASVEITVPPGHVTGELERPRNGAPDPERHFAAGSVATFGDVATFQEELRGRLAESDGRALLFIHGYRTRFDGAVMRMAQLVHDSGYQGTPVLFSWASAGRTVDYIYDNNSATIGRDGLERTLRLLAESGARRIDIVAHSMGNWVTMEALRQFAIAGDRDIGQRLGDVVLASPDIDVDVFKSQLQRIGRPDRPFFVLVSADDRALQLSSLIAGNRPRLGDYGEADDIARLGVIVVNVSDFKSGDSLNHAKFADNPVLVRLLGDRLREDDQLGADADQVGDRITRLAGGLGQTVGSAAEIIITTPIDVINVVVGN
jgi:esterase/lipase superfamily enzyme